jgi:outer membrane receptor protein involved in Fe transport
MDDLRDGPLGAAVAPGLSLIAINATTGRAQYYPGLNVCDSFGHTTFNSPSRGNICGSYDSVASRSISNKRENYSAYFYADKQISDNHQLWSSFTYYDSKAIASSGTEFWGSSGDPFNLTRTGALSSTLYINAVPASSLNPVIPAGRVQLQRVFMPFEVGGNEAVSTLFNENTYDFAFGLRGSLTDNFDYSASYSTARYEYVQDRPRLLAQAVHDRFLTPVLTSGGSQVFVNNSGVANLANSIYPLYNFNAAAWATPLTPQDYISLSTRVVNEGVTTADQFSFNVTGDLMSLPAGPLGFAGTFEWADQTIDLESDPRTDPTRIPDATTPYNLRSSGRVVGDRSRIAVGGELSVPVLESLRLQLAARYDKYDDITEVDDAITYNLGIEWRPTDKLLVRGAYATSFRAPDMPLVFAEGAAGFTGAIDQLACRTAGFTPTQCGTSGNAGNVYSYTMQNATSGNPDLKEEEGESITFGFVYDFGNNLNISVDYYRIDLSDAASVQSLGSILAAEANCTFGTFSNGDPYPNAPDSAFCQSIYPLVTRDQADPTDLNFPTVGRVALVNTGAINTAFSSNSGIDASLGYFYDTDSVGRLSFNLGYTLVMTEKYKQFDTDPLIDYRDSLFGNGQRSRVRGSVGWSYQNFNTTLFGSRYGSAPNATATNRLQPWMVYNLTMGYRFAEDFNATFIVNNVLNNYTRFDPTNTAYPFYDAFIGQDPRGRSFSLRLDYTF